MRTLFRNLLPAAFVAWCGATFMLIGLIAGFSAYADSVIASSEVPEISKTVSEADLPRSGCDGVIFRDEDPECFALGPSGTFPRAYHARTAEPVIVDFLTKGRPRQS